MLVFFLDQIAKLQFAIPNHFLKDKKESQSHSGKKACTLEVDEDGDLILDRGRDKSLVDKELFIGNEMLFT